MMTPARYPVPPIPHSSVVMADPLEVTSPAGPAGESPAGDKSLLVQMSSSGSVAQASVSPTSPTMSTPEVGPSSNAAAMDQYLPWNGSLVGESADCPLLPLSDRSIFSDCGVGHGLGHPRMPDLSREGPFDVLQDHPDSGASPRVLDGVRGCQYRMTSYDEEHGGPDFTPAYGIQLHDPPLLEYVGAQPQSGILVTPLRAREGAFSCVTTSA